VAEKMAGENIAKAEARVSELEARLKSVEFEYRRTQELQQRSGVSEKESIDAEANYLMMQAQLRQARADAANALNNKDDAAAQVAMQQASLAEAEEALADAQKRKSETEIKSRFRAIVTEVLVQKGVLVQSGTGGFTGGTPLMTLADISELRVVARVDDADYAAVREIAPIEALPEVDALRESARGDPDAGQRTGVVKLTVDALRNREFTGKIVRIEPQGKLPTGASVVQFDVHVTIDHPDWYLLPLGTQATVEFKVNTVSGALLIPAEAAKMQEGKSGVWVRTPPAAGEIYGQRWVECRFGISDGQKTEVLAVVGPGTLEPGAEVYTKLPSLTED
jgi:multidrug efflux pump subunit AcrA (membrane-fusion protein)